MVRFHQTGPVKFKNSKKQGDAGLGSAIAHFTLQGLMVALPLTDSQEYDLVIEENSILKKVQVKTSDYKNKYGIYVVDLTTKGGNKSGQTVKKFDKSKVDYLFILTEEGRYLIPSVEVTSKTNLNLGKKYQLYLIRD